MAQHVPAQRVVGGGAVGEAVAVAAPLRAEAGVEVVVNGLDAKRLEATADEMFVAQRKASMSAIIYEVLDLSSSILSPNGDIAASGAGIPAFIGVLDKAVKQIIDVAARHNASVVGPVPLPIDIRKYTVNRSAFIDKDSREQFEMRVHKRMIDILNPAGKVIEALTNMDLPSGVSIDVKMM